MIHLNKFGIVEFLIFHLIHRKRSPFPSRGRLRNYASPRLLLEEIPLTGEMSRSDKGVPVFGEKGSAVGGGEV